MSRAHTPPPIHDVKSLMRKHYVEYASYVIRERAIPDAADGLKPVQRRILYTLWKMHDGRLHKVMNVAGQTMALHPHGEVPIVDALVNLALKGFLLRMQGNFGNIITGDPNAAPRYIETALSNLALETLFHKELMQMVPSYDGRNDEPVILLAKIPLVLMQGADGIAVGMATHIFPHNFVELLSAQIALLEGKSTLVLPDFPTGGTMDATDYADGKGKIKLRAKIEVKDSKTLVIRQICYGTTTESLIHSIDEAAKRGKLRIEEIHDYTSDQVEIEIGLPRGYYAEDLVEALYAYTECEVTLHSQIIVIRDDMPWEPTVSELIAFHVEKVHTYLCEELALKKHVLLEKIFARTLDRIFIEEKLYKQLEQLATQEAIHASIAKDLEPFHAELLRVPTQEDRNRLLEIPIRRISLFDRKKNREEIAELKKTLKEVEGQLSSSKAYTIAYLRELIKNYGELFPRKTRLGHIEQVDKRAMETRTIQVGYDLETGFVGTKVTGGLQLSCSNFDKLLCICQNGSYKIIPIPEKQYVAAKDTNLLFVGVADKTSVLNLVYKDPKTNRCFGKRCIIKQFLMDRVYNLIEEGMGIQCITTAIDPIALLTYIPKLRQKSAKGEFPFADILVKGAAAKGVRLGSRAVRKACWI